MLLSSVFPTQATGTYPTVHMSKEIIHEHPGPWPKWTLRPMKGWALRGKAGKSRGVLSSKQQLDGRCFLCSSWLTCALTKTMLFIHCTFPIGPHTS